VSRSDLTCQTCGHALGYTNRAGGVLHASAVVTYIDLINGAARLRCPSCHAERTVRFLRIEMTATAT
jgi:LSD1 subclass zinc finger protein